MPGNSYTQTLNASSYSACLVPLLEVNQNRKVVQYFCFQIKPGMTEIDARTQDRQNKPQQVYHHSIGKMSNLKKLQMGLYRN
jgi:hypothetical protein